VNTPSLRRRVIVAGVTVTALGLLVASAAVALLYRQAMHSQLDDVLDERARLVADAAADQPDLAALTDDLDRRGLRVTLTAPDGTTYATDPDVPRVGSNLPRPSSATPPTLATRSLVLPDGTTATVSVSRDGIDAALRRLLLVEFTTAIVALAVVALLLRRATQTALRPLDTLIDTANDIADGHRDRRLNPTAPRTELGAAATAFDRMLDQLDHAVDTATSANEATRRFLDAAAHQLRTPITGASTALQTYRSRHPELADDQLLAIADTETARAGRLVTDLLQLARLDHGHLVTPMDVDVAPLLRDEAARAARRAPHLTLHLDISDPLPAHADPAATSEILANLLDNAIRYATTTIHLAATTDPDALTIHITDDGPGIAEEHRPRLFERFTTFDDRSDTGLGLAIAHELARAQHAELTYTGHFTLTLPTANRRPSTATHPSQG
jgi:two-component system OmpR family sensor kinase